MKQRQHFDIPLKDIVPEYYSSFPLTKWVFFKRFYISIDYLKRVRAKRILDAGCGDGLFLRELHSRMRNVSVVGVDLNVNTESLRMRNTEFIRMDLLKLPYKEEFDAVTCLDVLEHFDNLGGVLKVLKGSLKPRGYLVVSGPVEGFLYKMGRLFVKGRFSEMTGPGAGEHNYNIFQLDRRIQKDFELVERRRIYLLFAHLFDVNLYRKR